MQVKNEILEIKFKVSMRTHTRRYLHLCAGIPFDKPFAISSSSLWAAMLSPYLRGDKPGLSTMSEACVDFDDVLNVAYVGQANYATLFVSEVKCVEFDHLVWKMMVHDVYRRIHEVRRVAPNVGRDMEIIQRFVDMLDIKDERVNGEWVDMASRLYFRIDKEVDRLSKRIG